jgi:hypothetical protein
MPKSKLGGAREIADRFVLRLPAQLLNRYQQGESYTIKETARDAARPTLEISSGMDVTEDNKTPF